ncbi:Uncharacterized protein BM_BM17287 [Brugia malayi]|uniref:C2H2-type domain-containing protein n=1 Tax=Brugia malayi TaxID=6279 RepID=A0A4E9FUK6_BRUMA|nr:Uncharacterized protein BM_BM17287 [Brugia malayi]VIP00493.1 Uncharacterized protein BM_BM17287 [Brugia malayi]
MFFNIFMTAIIWFNLLLCIASDNETFHLPNFDTANEVITNNTYSGISNTFGFLDYLNFEPLFSSEFPLDPSQFIDFAQLSEAEDVRSEESKSETNQITNSPHLGFSDIYDPFGHTNLELSLSSDMDTYRSFWRDANEELKMSNDNLRYPSIRDAQNETSSSLNLNSDDIITYMHLPGSQQSAIFHQLALSSDDTSSQSATGEQSNIDNKYSDYLNILDYKENAYKESETGGKSYECLYPGCAVIPKSRNEYVTHRKTHSQPFIYECRAPGCGRTFDHRSSFCNHKQTHEPHPQCGRCGKLFVSRNGLNYHKKCCPTKSHERCYECLYPGCAMVTKSYKEYIAHRSTKSR